MRGGCADAALPSDCHLNRNTSPYAGLHAKEVLRKRPIFQPSNDHFNLTVVSVSGSKEYSSSTWMPRAPANPMMHAHRYKPSSSLADVKNAPMSIKPILNISSVKTPADVNERRAVSISNADLGRSQSGTSRLPPLLCWPELLSFAINVPIFRTFYATGNKSKVVMIAFSTSCTDPY